MSNRTGYRDQPPGPSEPIPVRGPLDEDAVPVAAAVLAALTDPVAVGGGDRPWAHAGRVAWRAAVLAAVVLLAYLPALLDPTLLDGEFDAFRRQPVPDLHWIDILAFPASLVGPPPRGTPPLLRNLVLLEGRLGNGPFTHRAAGVLLQAAVTVALWLVLRRLNRPGAWLAAAAFGVFPGSAAAVEWMGLRGRPWAALLALTGLWLLLRGLAIPAVDRHEPAEYDPDEEPGGWRRWLGYAVRPAAFAGAAVALVAAALCQPTVAAVGVIAVVLVAWRRGLQAIDWAWAGPMGVLVVAAAVAALRMPTPADQDPAVASLSAVLRPLWWVGRAVQRIAWPLSSADLAVAESHGRVLATCGLGAAVGFAVVAVVLLRRQLGSGAAVAVASAALLLPTMSVPPALPAVPGLTAATLAAGAATYLVVVPVLVALADALVAIARRVRSDLFQRAAELGVAAAAVLGLGLLTAVRAAAFDDTETILRTAVRVNGRSWADRSRLAEWYIGQHRPEPAFDTLSGLTLANCPDGTTAVAQGDLLRADGNADGAMTWYRRAAKLSPDAVDPVSRQSNLYRDQNRVGDAIDTYEQAIAAHPRSVALRNDFGNLLVRQGDLSLAEEQFKQSLDVNPDVADTHVQLASALATQKDFTGAAAELQKAVQIDPENFDAFHLAGVCLQLLGDQRRAAQMLTEAVRLNPDSAVARSDLSVPLIQLKKYKAAEFELKEALRLQPTLRAAQMNLKTCRDRAAAEQRRANVGGP